MALAHLTYTGGINGHQHFTADLGNNRYFRVMIGDYHTYRSYGVPLLEKKSFTSQLYGPIPEPKFGRIRFQVPDRLFQRNASYVQIISYRDKEENGMAVSDVERTMPSVSSVELPSIQLSVETMEINKQIISIPFQYKESGLSEAMFLDKIFNALPKILPVIGEMIGGGKANKKKGGDKKTSDISQQILGLIKNPEKLQQVLDLLKGVSVDDAKKGKDAAEAEATAGAQAVTFSSPKWSSAMIDPMTIMTLISTVVDGLEKLGKIGQQINKDELDTLIKLNPGVDDPDVQGLLNQMQYRHSGAMNMNPMDIMKLIGKITDGLEKLGKIGQQINKDELDTLIKLNPGVDDKDVQGLLNQMGIQRYNIPRIRFSKSAVVRLEVDGIVPVTEAGESVYMYAYGREMICPVMIHSPRDIPGGILQIIIRSKSNGEVILHHKMKHDGSVNGRLTVNPTIPAYLADDLVRGEAYDMYIAVLWKGKKDTKYGCSLEIPVTIASEYMFDRLGAVKSTHPLNDIDLHRSFWHKVWQDDFTDEVVRYEFECKYYFALEPDRKSNAQMETVEYLTPARPRKMEGKMKSGLVMSPLVLNQLLPTLGGTPLSEAQRSALLTDKFGKAQHRASRTGLKFHGKSGEMGALWVYPEVALREVILKKANMITAYGTIEHFTEEIIHFPIVSSAHFIGVKSGE